MNKIIALYIKSTDPITVKDVSSVLDSMARHKLDHSLWVKVDDKPEVQFAIAHNGKNIFLKYWVSEKHMRAVETEINGRIWEDSCVEFFISPDKGTTYYNLEFNSIGTGLISFGRGKNSREFLSKQLVKKTEVLGRSTQTNDGVKWELTLMIPVEIFIYHPVERLNGRTYKVNFYKCGDLLPEPHFIAWNKIESAEPNFHLPQFFGELSFE